MIEFKCSKCRDTGIGNFLAIGVGPYVSLEQLFREGVPCDCGSALHFSDFYVERERQKGIGQVFRNGIRACQSCVGSGHILHPDIGWAECSPCRGTGREQHRRTA